MRLGWEQLGKKTEAVFYWPPFPSSSSVFCNRVGLPHSPASKHSLLRACNVHTYNSKCLSAPSLKRKTQRLGMFAPKASELTPTLTCSDKTLQCTTSPNLSVSLRCYHRSHSNWAIELPVTTGFRPRGLWLGLEASS